MESYRAPHFLINGHFETIYPALLRSVPGINYQRERISTPDQDFLDLDWLKQSSKKLVVISHGLEGNSHRAYVKGMARIFFKNGYDVLAWNYRGCSEEMNLQPVFYHSGATQDLDFVINHAISLGYQDINLVGFSLGGNLTLKYLGEKEDSLQDTIKRAVAFSVPLNLLTSCEKISGAAYGIYSKRFMKSLKAKVLLKASTQPDLKTEGLAQVNSLLEFDDLITAPLHGFDSAVDYYTKCSSIHFLQSIHRPTLVVNALNDPFLSSDCYPDTFRNHPYLTLEYPERGGHVGFSLFNKNGLYWSELRALHFIQSTT